MMNYINRLTENKEDVRGMEMLLSKIKMESVTPIKFLLRGKTNKGIEFLSNGYSHRQETSVGKVCLGLPAKTEKIHNKHLS
jgi:hypothetical protein